MNEESEPGSDLVGEMPPLPAGGAEAPRIGAASDDLVLPSQEGLEATVSSGAPAETNESPATQPAVTVGWSEASVKAKQRTNYKKHPPKRPKPTSASNLQPASTGFARRTGRPNKSGKRAYAHSDPIGILILLVCSSPLIFAVYLGIQAALQ